MAKFRLFWHEDEEKIKETMRKMALEYIAYMPQSLSHERDTWEAIAEPMKRQGKFSFPEDASYAYALAKGLTKIGEVDPKKMAEIGRRLHLLYRVLKELRRSSPLRSETEAEAEAELEEKRALEILLGRFRSFTNLVMTYAKHALSSRGIRDRIIIWEKPETVVDTSEILFETGLLKKLVNMQRTSREEVEEEVEFDEGEDGESNGNTE